MPRLLFTAAPLLLWAAFAGAATVTWDGAGTSPTAPAGGSGTWDTTTLNWSNGTTDQAWPNTTADTAVFAGTAGTVTLGTTITLNAINFQTGGYTLTGGTLAFGGTTPTITAGAGLTETIASNISNSGGNALPATNVGTGGSLTLSGVVGGANGALLTNSGVGTTTLSGTADNSYLGATVNAGTLVLAKTSSGNAHAIGGNVTINNGGTLQLGGSGGDQIFYQSTVTMAAGATFDFNGRSESFNILSGASATTARVTNTAAGTTGTLQIGENNGVSTFAGTLQDGAGVVAFTKTGTGTATLSNAANAYSGVTTITGGTLSVGTLANGGTVSSIGNSTNAATNLVLSSGGVLSYTGATTTIDRGFTVGANGGSLNVATAGTTLTVSGAGNLGNNTLTAAGPGALVLTGTVGGAQSAAISVTAGSVTLGGTADNSFLSATVSGGGMLTLTKASGSIHALGGNLAITSGGRVQIAGTGGDQIYNGSTASGNVTLNAGTLGINASTSESVNSLTLSGGNASTLDLGLTGSVLRFADSSAQTWNGTLAITSWNGSSTGGGSDQVSFGTSANALTAAQVASISFVNPTINGNAQMGTFGAQLLSTGELVPAGVPEPSTGMACGFAILLAAGAWRHRTRRTN